MINSDPALLPSYALQIYYHGEPISVNVHVTNNTNKTVKKIKISGTPGRGSARGGQEGVFLRVGSSRRLSLVNCLVNNNWLTGKPRAYSKLKGKAFEADNTGCLLAR